MTAVLDGRTDSATYYEYDGSRKVLVQRHPNGSTTYLAYDGAGRLSEKVTKKDADGSVLVKFAYTRDAESNPISIERESGLGVYYYEHDARQRLAYEGQFIGAARQYENYYEYDLTGNRTLLRHGETAAENLTYYDYNAANELTQSHDKDGWTYFAYDATGNTVEEQTPSYTRYYDWDGRGLMTGVRSTEGGWTDNELAYDGTGALSRLGDSSGTSYYVWDDPESSLKLTRHPVWGTDMALDLLAKADESMSVTRRHVPGRDMIVTDDPVALIETGGAAVVPVQDELGTAWKTIDSSATVADSATYDAFGALRSSSGILSTWGYVTKERLADAALRHFPARPYAPARGAFAAKDPAGLGHRRAYQYADSSPAAELDPYGLDSVQKCMKMLRPLLDRCNRHPIGETRRTCKRNYVRHFNRCVEEERGAWEKVGRACDALVRFAESDVVNCLCFLIGGFDVAMTNPAVDTILDCIGCGFSAELGIACRGKVSKAFMFGLVTAFDCMSPGVATIGCLIGGVPGAAVGPPGAIAACLASGKVTDAMVDAVTMILEDWIQTGKPWSGYEACCHVLADYPQFHPFPI